MGKVSALTEVTNLTTDDLLYLVDTPGTTPGSKKVTVSRMIGLMGLNQFRLTTESQVPISVADRSAQATLYLTPTVNSPAVSGGGSASGIITLYDGTNPLAFITDQISLSLAGITSGVNYDVFCYSNGGTPTLELAAWTNDITRATSLIRAGNLLVKNGQTTRTYVGTIRASGSGVTADVGGGVTSQVGAQRFVWNYYNRVMRVMEVFDSTSTWTHNSASYHQANAAAGNKVEYVVGLAGPVLNSHLQAAGSQSGSTVTVSNLGLDSVTVPHPLAVSSSASSSSHMSRTASLRINSPIGYHALNWIEYGAAATTTFHGLDATVGRRSGISATIEG